MNKFVLSLAMVACLYGCATATKEELAGANYGPEPVNSEDVLKGFLSKKLKDPDSLQLRNVRPPEKFWTKNMANGFSPFWLICGEYNAKNSFGGFVGYKQIAVWFKNQKAGQLDTFSDGKVVSTFSKRDYPCAGN